MSKQYRYPCVASWENTRLFFCVSLHDQDVLLGVDALAQWLPRTVEFLLVVLISQTLTRVHKEGLSDPHRPLLEVKTLAGRDNSASVAGAMASAIAPELVVTC